MKLVERLRDASETGEIVRVVYFGGTQPGTTRDLAPRRIGRRQLRKGYVKALCLHSHRIKTFRLDRMQLAGSEDQYPQYQAAAEPSGAISRLWAWLFNR